MENEFEEDQTLEEQHSLKESPRNWPSESSALSSTTMTMSTQADGCFDCNICLDFAMDPVVTLCGHLYCWPCIYKWLELPSSTTQKQCPVCKTTLSETKLVPLYGRGSTSDNKETNVNGSFIDIPRRPTLQHHHRRYRPLSQYDYINGNTLPLHGLPQLLGISVMAMLPSWVFGEYVSARLSNRYYHIRDGVHGDHENTTSRQQQRHEMLMRRSLDQTNEIYFDARPRLEMQQIPYEKLKDDVAAIAKGASGDDELNGASGERESGASSDEEEAATTVESGPSVNRKSSRVI